VRGSGLNVLAYSSRKVGTYTFDFALRRALTGATEAAMDAGPDRTQCGNSASPDFTYVNMDINYDAGSFNDRNGNAVHVSGTYNVWALENIFYYVPNTKFLGGDLGFMVIFPTLANDSLVADFQRSLISASRAEATALPICGFSRLPWAGT
jgi:hypothetical protein